MKHGGGLKILYININWYVWLLFILPITPSADTQNFVDFSGKYLIKSSQMVSFLVLRFEPALCLAFFSFEEQNMTLVSGRE